MSLKFIRFELIKISVAYFGIGVNIKLEKGERLAKGSRGLGLGSWGWVGKVVALASNRPCVKSSSRQIVFASNATLPLLVLTCLLVTLRAGTGK